MKKLIKSALLLILIADYSYGQGGWFWQNPLPTGSCIKDCFFSSSNTGYSVGFDGTVLKSTNAGVFWSQLSTGSNKTYTSVFFVNNEKGYIITGDERKPNDNYLLLTTNGGLNWSKIFTFTNQHLTKILFLNENTGFVVGVRYWSGGRLYKTTNAGINWTQYTPDPTTNVINTIFFINNDTGYCAGDDGRILKTTNCGTNWISLRSGNEFFTDIIFVNNDTGFVCARSGKILKTTNTGINWFSLNSNTTKDLYSLTFINSETGFVAGGETNTNSGKLLRTTNTGITWDSIGFSNYSNFKKIFKSFNDELFLMGYWGAFYKSSNLGSNWNGILNFMTDKGLHNIVFEDNQNGILLGGGGFLAKTTNYGFNWNQINVNTNNSLINGNFIAPGKIIVTGSNGLILKSGDGGNNWINVSVPSSFSLSGLDFPKPNLGYIVGYHPNIGFQSILLKSTNEGMSWSTALLSGNNLFYDVKFIDSVTGFITDKRGNLLKTTNGGNSWSTIAFGEGNYLSSIFFQNHLTGYIGNTNGILKTTNSGINWQGISINLSGESFTVSSINFVNNNTGFVVGVTYHSYYLRSGVIFKTINSGLNWYHISDNNNLPYVQLRGFNSVKFLNDTIGYICGDRGTLFKSTNGGLFPIGLENVSSKLPPDFQLSQNYPNPFNPQTKIKFDVPKASFIKLIIYDLLGREVVTLVNKELRPGTYEADWNASSFSSGVYFYRIVSGDFIETKKMVLMK
jgi:photosystem II stability/assembly factor-like uncharacterized protein